MAEAFVAAGRFAFIPGYLLREPTCGYNVPRLVIEVLPNCGCNGFWLGDPGHVSSADGNQARIRHDRDSLLTDMRGTEGVVVAPDEQNWLLYSGQVLFGERCARSAESNSRFEEARACGPIRVQATAGLEESQVLRRCRLCRLFVAHLS